VAQAVAALQTVLAVLAAVAMEFLPVPVVVHLLIVAVVAVADLRLVLVVQGLC
jgi:hypothetical protein